MAIDEESWNLHGSRSLIRKSKFSLFWLIQHVVRTDRFANRMPLGKVRMIA